MAITARERKEIKMVKKEDGIATKKSSVGIDLARQRKIAFRLPKTLGKTQLKRSNTLKATIQDGRNLIVGENLGATRLRTRAIKAANFKFNLKRNVTMRLTAREGRNMTAGEKRGSTRQQTAALASSKAKRNKYANYSQGRQGVSHSYKLSEEFHY